MYHICEESHRRFALPSVIFWFVLEEKMTDIILIVTGLVIVVISFLITGREKETDTGKEMVLTQEQLDECFDQIEPELRRRVMELIDDSRKETVVKADDELGRIADEKQLQLEEYTKLIMEKIEENHQEVVFLYKMLSEKEEKLKEELLLMNQEVEEKKQQIKERMEELSREEERIVKKKKEVQKRERQADELARQMEEKKSMEYEQLEAERRLEEMLTPVVHLEEPADLQEKEDNLTVPEKVRENRREQILSMYRRGMPIVDISKELSMGQGEVKLVIDLYQKR